MSDTPSEQVSRPDRAVEDTRLSMRQKKQLVVAILVIFFAPIFFGLIYTAATG